MTMGLEGVVALVTGAGLSVVTKFEDTPLAEFHRVNAVNLSSVGGLRGAAVNAAYCTSKAAVSMPSKGMGAEFAALG